MSNAGLLKRVINNRGWASAAEWAALRMSGLAATVQNVNALAKREGWQSFGPAKARKRSGRGGGWEYHVSCLPEAAQAEFARHQRVAEAATTVATAESAQGELAARSAADLSARHKRAMEARATILREVDRRVFVDEISKRKAILSLISDVQWDQQAVKDGRGDQRILTPELLAAAEDANDRGRGLSRTRVYEWVKAFDAQGVAGLAPKKTKEKQNLFDLYPWLIPFLRHYAKPSRVTIAHALDNYAKSPDRIGDVPTYRQVKSALKALKGTSDHLMAHKGREGPLALKARSAFVSRSVEGLEPGTIYTGDGKTFDAEVQHPRHGKPFRPEITTIIDVATRKAVGWSVGLDENAELVAQAVLHAAQNHGIPAIFYADRGSGYKNQRISTTAHGLCARLGTTATHSLPYNSQARGAIERVHGTIWNRLAKDYPSYIGKDVDPEAAKRVFKESRRALQIIEGKRQVEDPKTLLKAQRTYARLIISWQQFVEDVDAAITEYNNAPHSSLRIRDPENGRMRSASPNEVWAQFEATGFQAFQLDPGEADDLYRPYEKRKTSRALVEIHTNSYFALELEPWHGEYVFVGYDIHDAQQVWVRQIDKVDGQEVPGPLICVAEFAGNEQRYMPASFQELAEERRLNGRMRRHQIKGEEIEAEARPQLEHQQVVELALPPLREPEPAPVNVVDAEVLSFQRGPSSPAPQPNRRNPFQDADLDLAWNIVEAPQDYEIPHGHIRLMSALLGNKAFLDMMREVGLPLTELADRITAAQSPRKSSNGDQTT